MLELGQDLPVPGKEEGPHASSCHEALNQNLLEPLAQPRQRKGGLCAGPGRDHAPRLPGPGMAAVDLEEERTPEPCEFRPRYVEFRLVQAKARRQVLSAILPATGQGAVNIGLAQAPVEDVLSIREGEQGGEVRVGGPDRQQEPLRGNDRADLVVP